MNKTVALTLVGLLASELVLGTNLQVPAELPHSPAEAPPPPVPTLTMPIAVSGIFSPFEAIDRFLQGARIYELQEGKDLVRHTTWWDLGGSLPIFSGSHTLFESSVETDIPGVQGFKRLVELSGQSSADGRLLTWAGKRLKELEEGFQQELRVLEAQRQAARPGSSRVGEEQAVGHRATGSPSITAERYLVVAFKERRTSLWKVLFITNETDTGAMVAERRAALAKRSVHQFDAQPSLKRYWLALALVSDGKLGPAAEELSRAQKEISKEKSTIGTASVDSVARLQEIVKRIVTAE